MTAIVIIMAQISADWLKFIAFNIFLNSRTQKEVRDCSAVGKEDKGYQEQ